MKSELIRKKFLEYFRKQEHVIVRSSSLIPLDDPTVLFTTAGMQQLKPYFLGELDPGTRFRSKRLASIQRCFRTSDIEFVGDGSHLTFFEMLGNFSIGDYSKEGAIRMAWECLTKVFRISSRRLWATIFIGDNRAVKDFESFKIWQTYIPSQRIAEFGRSENWWGPTGTTGPCGPSSEIHVSLRDQPCERAEHCLPNCNCGRFLEIWNLVFMEYYQNQAGAFRSLPMKNVDTGMGLERIAMVLQKKQSVFETDLFVPIVQTIESQPGFGIGETQELRLRRLRISADHLKGTVFLLADGVRFSNKAQGYTLRRIFRRALDQFSHPLISLSAGINAIIDTYRKSYPSLLEHRDEVQAQLREEAEAYDLMQKKTLNKVLVKFRGTEIRTGDRETARSAHLTADEAFELYATHGLSLEKLKREGFTFDVETLNKKISEHRQQSRVGMVKKFGGHGLGYSATTSGLAEANIPRITRLHTATHLLHQALRTVLGSHVMQQGSDITPDRLRFDFTHPTKTTPEELRKVEELVNQQIARNLPVHHVEMDLSQALANGALSFFQERYPERVRVYSIGDFSKEICGGPHVSTTSELVNFTILSEKSSGAGVRRIKATIKP